MDIVFPSVVPVHPIQTHEDLLNAALTTKPKSSVPLGQYLVNLGLLTPDELAEGLVLQRKIVGRRIGWILKTLGHFDDLMLQRLVADHLGVPCVSLDQYRPSRDYRSRLPAAAARERGLAVIHEDGESAWVTTPEVTDESAVRAISRILGKRVIAVMVPQPEVLEFLRRVSVPVEEALAA